MTRKTLPRSRVHAAIQGRINDEHRDFIDEVERATLANDVVVVGMRWNPYPRKACDLLKAAGIQFTYIEHGSYFSGWRRRNALKMWTGWPTFPMVFVRGVLIGGYDDLKQLQISGELATMLTSPRSDW
ncbi:MAG: glutaredoxin domain-containing protein [Burkholderiaceae bacterium]|jgi:glutaredoxin-related protein